jgi:hypothetical protein
MAPQRAVPAGGGGLAAYKVYWERRSIFATATLYCSAAGALASGAALCPLAGVADDHDIAIILE